MAHITFIESYNGVPPPTTGLWSCIHPPSSYVGRSARYWAHAFILTAEMPRSFLSLWILNSERFVVWYYGISIWIYISHIATGEASAASVYNIRRPFLPTVNSYGGDASVIFISLNSEFREICHMVLWCYGVMILWCYGVMVLWYYGVMVLWYYGVMVLWCYGVMVLWCYGVMVLVFEYIYSLA